MENAVKPYTTVGTSRESRQRRPSWGRLVGTAAAALAVGVATLAVTGPAQGLNTGKTGDPDPATGGFPAHYTDNSGVSLQLCVDGTARCGGATAADDGAGGPGVSVAPDGEGFYWMATATLRSPRGRIDVEFAHEAAWASATQPIVFDRTRIRGDMRPGRYTLLTPYGRTRFDAVGTGQRNVNLTQDPGCAQARGGPCSKKMTNWLRAVGAPVGYIGNGVALTRVRGGTERNNLVLLDSKGRVIGSTGRFAITGQLADGPGAVLSTNKVIFGNTSKLAKRTIRLKNQGTAPLTLRGIRVGGDNTIKLSPTGCVGRASLASGADCNINLTYRPGLRRRSSATLTINDNTIAGVHRVPIRTGVPR
jgi:hypothetical protein